MKWIVVSSSLWPGGGGARGLVNRGYAMDPRHFSHALGCSQYLNQAGNRQPVEDAVCMHVCVCDKKMSALLLLSLSVPVEKGMCYRSKRSHSGGGGEGGQQLQDLICSENEDDFQGIFFFQFSIFLLTRLSAVVGGCR